MTDNTLNPIECLDTLNGTEGSDVTQADVAEAVYYAFAHNLIDIHTLYQITTRAVTNGLVRSGRIVRDQEGRNYLKGGN